MKTGPVAALLGLLLLVLTACSGSSEAGERGGEGETPAGAESVDIAIAPGDGATDVATSGALEVTAEHGTLTEVTVTDAEGAAVPGELSEDGTSWRPGEHLANGTDYTVTATGENAGGEEQTRSAAFTTTAADATFTSNWNIADGATVGAGMVLSMTFDTPIEDMAAVRDAVRISAEPHVDVRGHWFGNQRLDFRPEEYWAAGTEVTVSFRVRGVEGAPGVYGTLYEDVTFTVGRSQVTTVDAAAMTMEVVRDGESLRTIPVTTGAPGTPTWNGKMVITEKHEETRMDGSTVGFGGEYDIPDVPHAMRLSTSGTFIHGNYWASGSTFGSENVSHGCVGLQDTQGANDSSTPGSWFYENSMIGDVVEVINSDDDVIAPDNGINGWNMAWAEWGAGQE
ncbi:Ig-like domain-containing protein [Streptomyces sp. MP131-18]|uniref:L,D-transpeptidase n=1 Tax=Streptomyces sp. MP131-18 TaxID=1857892 RepID=UPI0009C6C39E|nr:Ig-like domain-containing protein [Streptomyces sp. MP131-18]ONK11069.1 putative L,D-transpeptidase LppS precursor [Streptomyces sp. MP131-18]